MKAPTLGQKRAVATLAEPLVALLHRTYRLATGRGGVPLLRPEAASRVRKVLAVRLDAIGDLLLSEPAIALLRRRFPHARLDLVANPASAAVLRGNPAVDRLITYGAPWHASWRGARVDWVKEAARFWAVTAALRREEYDLGFELRGDIRDIAFLAAAGPGTLVGSGVRGGGSLLDYDAPQPADAHQVELALAIAAAGGDAPSEAAPRLYLGRQERDAAAALVPPGAGRTYVGLHLGAGFPSKCLPVAKFAEVAQTLLQREPRRRFVVIGGPEERPLAEELAARLSARGQSGEPVLTLLPGRLSLLETAAVLERCVLFIGNDSAPMHLAAAVGTPVVTFFGPSEPWRFHPYGAAYRLLEVTLECRPCDYVHCRWEGDLRFQCMTRQSVEAISAAAEDLLAVQPARASGRPLYDALQEPWTGLQ
ncbi:MAG: glycosyltransferase family 9 protein [Chloroflexi bacterium]|nr:glycosyltransferase family 9 protein [Chloroflexota bacterium]